MDNFTLLRVSLVTQIAIAIIGFLILMADFAEPPEDKIGANIGLSLLALLLLIQLAVGLVALVISLLARRKKR